MPTDDFVPNRFRDSICFFHLGKNSVPRVFERPNLVWTQLLDVSVLQCPNTLPLRVVIQELESLLELGLVIAVLRFQEVQPVAVPFFRVAFFTTWNEVRDCMSKP